MRNARKTPKILELEKPDEVQKDPFKELFKPDAIVERSKRSLGISGAMTVNDVLKTLKKPKDYEILRALQESDKLIRNLVREGAISEDSIFTQQVLSANSKILRK